jgi:hypothetical protein
MQATIKLNLKEKRQTITDSWNVSTKNQVITSIEVFSILGNSALRIMPNAESVEVDISGLTPGIYITEISTALGTETKKLIKQ